MNIVKRLLNIVLVLTVTSFVIVLSALLVTSFERKMECDANQALPGVCAKISIDDCAKTREAERIGEDFELALFLTPLYCSDDQPEYWQSNLVRYVGFYSGALVTMLLLLTILNYVLFGAATLWHKSRLSAS